MARTKRYDEGGMTEEDVRSFAGIPENESNAGMKEAYTKPEPELTKPEPTKSEPANFKQAFAAARKAGDKTFEFGGKKYTTELASSKPAKVTDTGDEASRLAARMPKPALKYQSLQDREIEAEAKRRAEGRSFYGTNKMKMPEREERKPLSLKSTKSETGYTGMGSLKFSKGGSTASRRADGIAQKGKTRGKIY